MSNYDEYSLTVPSRCTRVQSFRKCLPKFWRVHRRGRGRAAAPCERVNVLCSERVQRGICWGKITVGKITCVHVYVRIVSVKNARENSWKATAAAAVSRICPANCTRIKSPIHQSGKRICGGVGGESDTHSCSGGKLPFSSILLPLAGSPVCPSRRRLEPSVLHVGFHTQTPRHAVSHSICYVCAVFPFCVCRRTHIHTRTHTYMRDSVICSACYVYIYI